VGNIGITAWKRSWNPGIYLFWSPTWRPELDLSTGSRQPLFPSADWSSNKFPAAFKVEVVEVVRGVHPSDDESQFDDVGCGDEGEGQHSFRCGAQTVARKGRRVCPRLFVYLQRRRAVGFALVSTQVRLLNVNTTTTSCLQPRYFDFDTFPSLCQEPVCTTVVKRSYMSRRLMRKPIFPLLVMNLPCPYGN